MKVKATISKNDMPYRRVLIGNIGKNGNFKFLSKDIKKACYDSLKRDSNYEGSVGGTLTIPDYIERETGNKLMNKVIKNKAEMVKADGYVTCFHLCWPEKVDNKKYILSYKR